MIPAFVIFCFAVVAFVVLALLVTRTESVCDHNSRSSIYNSMIDIDRLMRDEITIDEYGALRGKVVSTCLDCGKRL